MIRDIITNLNTSISNSVEKDKYLEIKEHIKELLPYAEIEEKLGFDPTIFKQDFETLMKEHRTLDTFKERARIVFQEFPNGLFQVVAFSKEQTGIGLGIELYFGKCKEKYDLLKEVLGND